ncbi:MAG: phosphoribosylamine--glycine ligase [Candidatus Hodarchaeales archaeon]|jgi:phosphoribosylamine--glycine ligase
MNRFLLVGNGAREHVISEALVKFEEVHLFAFMSTINPGIKKLSKGFQIGDLGDNEQIVKYAKSIKADFALIGPEIPLSNGIVDSLEKAEIECAAPNREMSKIEWSKAYARNFMKNNMIPGYPEFYIFSHEDNLEDIERKIQKIMKDFNNQIVLKPDYLTGGKGVKVWGDHLSSKDEIIDYIKEVLTKGTRKVIVEEKLQKPNILKNSEFTFQALVSGNKIIPMPLVQDFKRAFNGDKGPNTGSMGSYSLSDHKLSFLSDEDYNQAINIMKKTVMKLGNYKGVLYGQFMLTDKGVNLIEFNSRFGDPEAMNVLPLLLDDFSKSCEEIIDGNLKKKNWLNRATVCVYLTPIGYPTQPKANEKIIVNSDKINGSNCKLYYASVDATSDGKILTTSSRAIGILGLGESINEARDNAYNVVNSVSGKLHFRTDIGEGVS